LDKFTKPECPKKSGYLTTRRKSGVEFDQCVGNPGVSGLTKYYRPFIRTKPVSDVMQELFSYKSCTITVDFERFDFDCGPSLFKATASVKSAELQLIAEFVGKADESLKRACTAILMLAKREIECRERAYSAGCTARHEGKLPSHFPYLRLVTSPHRPEG
jgi:hypothetical protein